MLSNSHGINLRVPIIIVYHFVDLQKQTTFGHFVKKLIYNNKSISILLRSVKETNMRQGMGNDGIIMNDVEECAGIHLRADYCAEHEWGIKGFKRSFGMDETKLGIEKRRIRNNGGVYLIKFTKKGEKCALLSNYRMHTSLSSGKQELNGTDVKEFINENRWFDLTHNEQSEGVAGAWDENYFLFVVKGSENISKIEEVYDAFQENDIAIFLGGGSKVFQNSGLSIAIISQLPEEIIRDMKNVDMNSINLQKAADKTGIAKKLEKAGLGYYALRPDWKDPEDPTEGVKFWLNPREQHLYNHGWYDIDELKLWIKGKGPIPKKKEPKKERKVFNDTGDILLNF